MKPKNFGNWMQAWRWCKRAQRALHAKGAFHSPSKDCKISRVVPVIAGKGICYVSHTGPGFATQQLMSHDTVLEIDVWEKTA